MRIPDIINGGFELFGSVAIWRNVYALWKDKEVKGARVEPMLFFLLWGVWNLYYYPFLGQLVSFCGGVAMTVASLIYTGQMIYYNKTSSHSSTG